MISQWKWSKLCVLTYKEPKENQRAEIPQLGGIEIKITSQFRRSGWNSSMIDIIGHVENKNKDKHIIKLWLSIGVSIILNVQHIKLFLIIRLIRLFWYLLNNYLGHILLILIFLLKLTKATKLCWMSSRAVVILESIICKWISSLVSWLRLSWTTACFEIRSYLKTLAIYNSQGVFTFNMHIRLVFVVSNRPCQSV